MTVGTWQPDASSPSSDINSEWLQQFAAIAENDQLDDIASQLSEAQKSLGGTLMRYEHALWQPVLEPIATEQLLQLVRFFTVAEEALSGWEAGKLSPVIWIARELKKRGTPLDRETLLWIRANSKNRFIPHGGL